jgi:protein TonB
MATAIRFDRSANNMPPGVFQSRPDNFSTMLFIAALFHSVLVLGVSFTAADSSNSSSEGTAVDVVLLAREYEQRADNEDANYIAQQNLAGAGNTTENEELRVSYGRNANPFKPGPEQEGVEQSTNAVDYTTQSEQVLYARARESGAISQREEEHTPSEAPERTGMPGTANTIEILAAPDTETILQGAKPRELIVSANTRESRIAAYLDSWKRRVERVGTSNFPRELLSRPDVGNPTLEVHIAANGKLTDVVILHSSGIKELDMAAVDILRLASPFDAFPEYLRSDYDSLRFSYEWRFNGRSVSRMKVPADR